MDPVGKRLLLTIDDLVPTHPDLAIVGVFNPGAVRFGDEVVLLVRVAQAPREEARPGWLLSPRGWWEDGRMRYRIDRIRLERGGDADHRKPLLESGYRRLAFISHLELVRLASDGTTVKAVERREALFGQHEGEEFGVEDPRITRIGDDYFITCVTVSERAGVCTALMSTSNFEGFHRHGVVFPTENKDVVLFSEKVNGRFAAYHRPVSRIRLGPLAIWAAFSPGLHHWGGHAPVLSCAPEPGWYSERIGAGPPPLRTEAGWLTVFHGVEKLSGGDPIGRYAAGLMLTSLEDPSAVIATSRQPFMTPQEPYEVSGYVDNVVFPSGIVRDLEDPDLVHIYCGCADTAVGVKTYSLSALLRSLEG